MSEGRPIKIVEPPPVDNAAAWDKIRQGLIILLGGVEDLMGVERSITPRRKLQRQEQADAYSRVRTAND